MVAMLVPVTVAIRVQFTRECCRQRSGHMDKPVLYVRASPQVKDETVAGFGVRGCAMNLVSLSVSLVEETTSTWVTPQHPLVLSYTKADVKLCHGADWGRGVVAIMIFPR